MTEKSAFTRQIQNLWRNIALNQAPGIMAPARRAKRAMTGAHQALSARHSALKAGSTRCTSHDRASDDLFATALEDVERKRHKRDPFQQKYLNFCLSQFGDEARPTFLNE